MPKFEEMGFHEPHLVRTDLNLIHWRKRKLMFCVEKDYLRFVFNIKVKHSENVMQCHVPMWLVAVETRSGQGVQRGALDQVPGDQSYNLEPFWASILFFGCGRVHLSRPQFLHLQNRAVW